MSIVSGKASTVKMIGVVMAVVVFFLNNANAQKMIYSLPDRNESKQVNFEIIGKYGTNILVYKNYKSSNYISVYNDKMELVENVAMPYMPERLIESNFIAYPDFSYLFFQYVQKGIVYCKAVKLGADGKSLTQPIEIDTTQVGSNTDSKIYQIIPSQNKKQIMVMKINSRNESRFIFKTMLFDDQLSLKHTTANLGLEMRDRFDFLTDFDLDNDGNLVFGKGLRPGANENISKFYLTVKAADKDTFAFSEISFDKGTLDEVKLKIDNFNNRYLFTCFYYAGRRGTIEGIANAIFDKKSNQWVVRNSIPLSDEIRNDARGDNNIKNAFDDYFIHDITIRSDGAFLVNAESMYQTNRGSSNPYNRWNYMNPWMSPMDYYRWGGMGGYGSAWNNPYYNSSAAGQTRYHADNVMILAFDNQGKMILSNFVRKEQFDDNNEAMVSYQMVNTGNGLQYLYNEYDRREVILSYQTLGTDGRVTRNPTIKNITRDYSFLPKYSKQIDTRLVIIPCLFRSSLCFAKLEFQQ